MPTGQTIAANSTPVVLASDASVTVTLVTTGLTTYQIYPGSVASSSVANMPLPTIWRVVVTAVNAFATTYTVSAALIG